ncbi:polyprenyl synthetase family protein [Bacillus weihaiensis]|nr:polyprenyl synthetase family protein [Bacillus weihaiensis]
MKRLLEMDSHQKIIDCASGLIKSSFIQEELRLWALGYINFKLSDSTNFSKITGIHYDIFRGESNEEEKISILTIAELILLASDIMDDLQDDDAGENPWADVSLGQNLNIVVGILIICLKHIDDIDTSPIVKDWLRETIHRNTLQSINGQYIDLSNNITLESEYISMVSLKSGSLIKVACLLGAGRIDDETLQKIETYSNHLGIIAQIRNDVHDLVKGSFKSDIMFKKKTLPILYYLNRNNPKFLPIQDYYLGDQLYSDMTYKETTIFHETLIYGGGVEYCKVLEQLYIHKFKECINNLDLSSFHKDLLINMKI